MKSAEGNCDKLLSSQWCVYRLSVLPPPELTACWFLTQNDEDPLLFFFHIYLLALYLSPSISLFPQNPFLSESLCTVNQDQLFCFSSSQKTCLSHLDLSLAFYELLNTRGTGTQGLPTNKIRIKLSDMSPHCSACA
uniref:Uncharacterized protein n=1 Tax=Lates calcarifer TaxID=8187 RepID=A0A4W6D0G6_LATCA